MENMNKALLLHMNIEWLSGGKALRPLFELGTSYFYHRAHILIERMTDRKTMVNKTWIFGRLFLENEQSKLVTSRKTRQYLLPMIRLKCYLKQKLDFITFSLSPVSLETSQNGKILWFRWWWFNNVVLKISYDESVNTWKVCKTQWINIFQMYSVTTSCMNKIPIQNIRPRVLMWLMLISIK